MEINKKIELIEQKQILLKILDEVDMFCKKENIKYFLCGGTLLGAIRHNGFIPWDDDIDIIIPREDYDRFINTFYSETGNVILYAPSKKIKGYYYPYAKCSYKGTLLIEDVFRPYHIGINIDVFPFDYVGDDCEKVKKVINRVSFLKNTITIKHLKVDKNRNIVKNSFIILSRLLYIIPDSFLNKLISKKIKKSTYNHETKYVANILGAWGLKEISMSEYFRNVETHLFEGKYYNIPSGYDNYLTGVYNDYMQLPPIEKRKTHHESKAFWID